MRRASAITLVLAAGLALASAAQSARALSIASMPPHDRKLACDRVKAVLAGIARRDAAAGPPLVSTDALGLVAWNERDAFLDAMTRSEGRADERPLRLAGLYRLGDDRFAPVYLARIERQVWHAMRREQDGMGETIETPDPHYATERSTWLVTFSSNQVERLREVPEGYLLQRERRRVRCR